MATCNLRDGFACYGGTEIWNVCRTLHYVDTLLPRNGFQLTVERGPEGDFCCGCCLDAYVDPATDEVPWYVPGIPESAGFFGIIPTTLDGLSLNPTTRASAISIGGSIVGRRFEAGREISVVGVAYADSCDAMDYGLAWLHATLERDCGTAGFTWQACCPPDTVSSGDFNALNYRTIPCVALTTGIEATPYNPEILGGYAYEVEFDLTAEKSWIYEQPIELFEDSLIPGVGSVCIDYTPDCISGAVIEVFVDRALNTGTQTVDIYSGPAKFLPPGDMTKNNAMYGASITVGPGEGIFYDPRCLGVSVASVTGKAVRPASRVALIPRAQGLFGVAGYGETWKMCVAVLDNGLGQVGVRIRAHPRRRI